MKDTNQSKCSCSSVQHRRMNLSSIGQKRKLKLSWSIGLVFLLTVASVLAISNLRLKNVLKVAIPEGAIMSKFYITQKWKIWIWMDIEYKQQLDYLSCGGGQGIVFSCLPPPILPPPSPLLSSPSSLSYNWQTISETIFDANIFEKQKKSLGSISQNIWKIAKQKFSFKISNYIYWKWSTIGDLGLLSFQN